MDSPLEGLSDRELEVFQLIGRGLTMKEIGDELHLSPKTIEVHRAHIREKLHVGSAAELVSYAARWSEKPRGHLVDRLCRRFCFEMYSLRR